ncbi:hypothetical protein [Aquibacillus sediminis]|uniref:hypothetical protein n=1 Tax=Aquibacillus sediminis TaxID=2574734 RepID=UPI001109E2C2|nr:hypothetical protein [Aquibacillus sediminis]
MGMYESFMEAFTMKVMQALPQDVAYLACVSFLFRYLLDCITHVGYFFDQQKIDLPITLTSD